MKILKNDYINIKNNYIMIENANEYPSDIKIEHLEFIRTKSYRTYPRAPGMLGKIENKPYLTISIKDLL